MNERAVAPTQKAIDRQKQASDPNISAWVEAHAGSGKTHVLTQRVVRLLLNGAQPENLLCLTYTKAAAAEMRARVANYLSQWAIMEDKELAQSLFSLIGKAPSEKLMLRARTLFAYALEAPGGLKINTIHAFCESLLHRFSLEANVPIGFNLIDEEQQKQLINNAKDNVLAMAFNGYEKTAKAVEKLFALMGDSQIEAAINQAIHNSAKLSLALANIEQAKEYLHEIMLYDGQSINSLQNQVADNSLLTPKDFLLAKQIYNENPLKAGVFINLILDINVKEIEPEKLLKAFIVEKGTIRSTLLLKQQKQQYSDLQALFEKEAERLLLLNEKIKIARIVERSKALIDVLAAIFDKYNKQKHFSMVLDYSDLIEKTRLLLTNAPSMEWVLYKLDANIFHILVDESQDTNPEQWAVISRLWNDFFAGKSAVEAKRTIFAVGDKKQSIFSFQGAKPELFANTGNELSAKAKNVKKDFVQSELKTSFRTLENILLGVDRVCKSKGLDLALLSDGKTVKHESARIDKGGSITLWPPIKPEENKIENNQWPLEKDALASSNTERKLAQRIVENIKSWLDNKRPLAQRGRAIRANDILILLQSRKALFHEIIRALKLTNIPTPGSDRLSVSAHIGVLDLLALADILLNPHDDLTLATILRSPLFDISEQQLYEIAANRGKKTSLWQALKNAKNLSAQEAFKQLSNWRKKLNFERPYEFFSQILYQEGGLKRFHKRLGSEVDDVFSQFLDMALNHEQDKQPSLQGFIALMRNSDIFIKRELSESENGVRIMSVHGAKGLEAPIVILADSTNGVSTKSKPLHIFTKNNNTTLIHAPSKEDRIGLALELYEKDKANEKSEYWRKLYVGMTRAEDELYLTGTINSKTKLENTWYGMVENALSDDLKKCKIIGSDEEGFIFPATQLTPAKIKNQSKNILHQVEGFAPKIAPLPKFREIIRPSSVNEDYKTSENEEAIFATNTSELFDATIARKKGVALHALLQHLVQIEPNKRASIAKKALNVLLPDTQNWHDELIEKAISILSNPNNKHMFGANSRAEVPFFIDGLHNEKPISIAGRIDRIIIEDESVLLVDFKSDSNAPENIEQIAKQYIKQMGLYGLAAKKLFAPKKIQVAIFWTSNEKLIYLPDERLKQAIVSFKIDD